MFCLFRFFLRPIRIRWWCFFSGLWSACCNAIYCMDVKWYTVHTVLYCLYTDCCVHSMLHHAKVAVLTNRSGMFDDDIVVVCYTYIFRYEIWYSILVFDFRTRQHGYGWFFFGNYYTVYPQLIFFPRSKQNNWERSIFKIVKLYC